MTDHTSPFTAPEAELAAKAELIPKYSNLNFWRKFYLVLMWGLTSLMCLGFIVSLMFTPINPGTPGVGGQLIGLSIIVAIWGGLAYWQHTAIVNRKLTQLTVLTIISIFPFFNIIGAIILLAIRQVTKKEHQLYKVIDY